MIDKSPMHSAAQPNECNGLEPTAKMPRSSQIMGTGGRGTIPSHSASKLPCAFRRSSSFACLQSHTSALALRLLPSQLLRCIRSSSKTRPISQLIRLAPTLLRRRSKLSMIVPQRVVPVCTQCSLAVRSRRGVISTKRRSYSNTGKQRPDYLLAHILALDAMAKGFDRAKWLSVATLDRYLQLIGQPQVFGTQYPLDPKLPHPVTNGGRFSGRTQLPFDDAFLARLPSSRLLACLILSSRRRIFKRLIPEAIHGQR